MASNTPERGHRYLPSGPQDRREMLDRIGVGSVDDLFEALPQEIRRDVHLDVEGPYSDQDLRRLFRDLEGRNRVAGRDLVSFLGGGAYRHESPAVIDNFLTRSEYLTVYTPYQPEVSQGTLQAIFEFQTFISLVTGLPVANASMYEGGSAFAEAVLMAMRVQRKRRKVVMARSIHPHYRQTLRTYVDNLGLELVEVGWEADGSIDRSALEAAVDGDTICVALQSPNYFGVVESWGRGVEAAKRHGALTIGVVAEALSMALLQSPGEGGCDIAVGDAHSFGLPLSFGGPFLGFLAAGDAYKRAMPGRLVGQTVDARGDRAFVLTLATREQHIRREKATSNICTNQALCALAATIYLSLHGKVGLRRLAEINLQRAAALRARLASGTGCSSTFEAPCFNEFAVRTGEPVANLLADLEAAGVLAGVPLGPDYPELEDSFLVAVTECNPPADLDRLVEELRRRTLAKDVLPIPA
ncbi:MAG: aminomethyl-transferring glycine dehydrogenase subunit GcvPA [Acidobacteria bacterium]|nr:aminomethyl-transferring glycine dehydrogenase subunit GcvPA [Acidobacteriota bacterium]